MKIRVTRKSIATIDVEEDNYPAGSTPEQMVEIDRKNIQEDPSIMDDWLTDDEITVEMIS